MNLVDYFDRVVVLNLGRRSDRWGAFCAHMEEREWPFRAPERFDAIDGSKVPVGHSFVGGGGAWGCLRSHQQVLEKALMDGVNRLLVLEDDLVMRPSVAADAERFLCAVPPMWDQLMLGGQHMRNPWPVAPGVVRCLNCQRTHAYAVTGRFMRDLYSMWCSPATLSHCDHSMGPMQSKYKVYAPEPFLFGQGTSNSDISGNRDHTRFWQPPSGQEPVILLDCPQEVVAELRGYGIHTGYYRDLATDLDRGLLGVIEDYTPQKLKSWMDALQWECVAEDGMVLGVWHPAVTVDMVREAGPSGPILTVKADNAAAALAQINALLDDLDDGRVYLAGDAHMPPSSVSAEGSVEPAQARLTASRLRPSPSTRFVILLNADRQTAGQLRGLGWHTGHWRDPVTEYDNGLREWAESKSPHHLREIVATLVQEAQTLPRGVAVLWHPAMTVEEAQKATALTVVPITAITVADAVKAWRDFKENNL